MLQYHYAGEELERAERIEFQKPQKTYIDKVHATIRTIARRLISRTDVPVPHPPPKGFLRQPLSRRQKDVLNGALGKPYATQNVEQQGKLKNIGIAECGEEMVSLEDVVSDRAQVSFSTRKLPEGCRLWVMKLLKLRRQEDVPGRVMCIRHGVAQKIAQVCRSLNDADLMMHVEDCWRPPAVQEGLFIRRLIKVARDYSDLPWEEIKTIAMSLTASVPGLAGHQAGAAIDWRLRYMGAKEDFLPLGNDYPDGGAVSSLHFPYLTAAEWKTRIIFSRTMQMAGFRLLSTEDWHGSFGDIGLGFDDTGWSVQMTEAIYGPLRDFHLESGNIECYSMADLQKNYLTDQEIRMLVDKSRQRKSSGEYIQTLEGLVAKLHHGRNVAQKSAV